MARREIVSVAEEGAGRPSGSSSALPSVARSVTYVEEISGTVGSDMIIIGDE